MTRSLTPRLGLQTWSDDNDTWDRADFAGNFEALDAVGATWEQGELADLFGLDGPDPTVAGQLYYTTDLGLVFRSDGARWAPITAVIGADAVVTDPSDPTTTTAELNAAIDLLASIGGGRIEFGAAVYMLEPADAGDPAPWTKGGIVLRPGVALAGGGPQSTLRWAGGPGSMIATPEPSEAPVLITADVAAGDYTYTVASSATFDVGDLVAIRLGQVPVDHPEALWWTFARVADVADGTHVTVDRAAGIPVDVSTISDGDAPGNRSIRRIPAAEAFIGTTISGLRLECDDPEHGAMEFGINLRYVQGVEVRDVTYANTGAGLAAYYSDGVTFTNCTCVGSRRPVGGHTGYGRGFTLSSVKAARIERCHLTGIETCAVMCEFGTDLTVDGLEIANTFPSRIQTVGLIFTGEDTVVRVAGLRVTGEGTKVHLAESDGTDRRLELTDLDIATTTTMLHVPLYALRGPSRFRTVLPSGPIDARFHTPRPWSTMFPLPYGETVDVPLPAGLISRLRVYVSTLTGVTASTFIAGAGADDTPIDLVADELTEISAQSTDTPVPVAGSAGFGSWTTGNAVRLAAGATPAGAYGIILADVAVEVDAGGPADPATLTGVADVSHLVRTARLSVTDPVATYTVDAGELAGAGRALTAYTPDPMPDEVTVASVAAVEEIRGAVENMRVSHDEVREVVIRLLGDLTDGTGIVDLT